MVTCELLMPSSYAIVITNCNVYLKSPIMDVKTTFLGVSQGSVKHKLDPSILFLLTLKPGFLEFIYFFDNLLCKNFADKQHLDLIRFSVTLLLSQLFSMSGLSHI